MGTATAFGLHRDTVAEIELALPLALRGDGDGARRYAQAWRRVVRELLEPYPNMPDSSVAVLEHLALTAPFGSEGALATLVSVATAIIPGMQAPTVTTRLPARPPEPAVLSRFTRLVLAELEGTDTGLETLMGSWHLSVTDVGRLFGVRRQAVQQWLENGVPTARHPKLLAILGIADLLERNLLPERIPAVVRAPSEAGGGRSMLEEIAADRHAEVLERTRRSFDWAWSA